MSDYIPQLREQLVAAAARERAGERHRPLVAPRTVAIALVAAAVALAIVLAAGAIDLPNDERPVGPVPAGAGLEYRVAPAPGSDAAAAAQQSAGVLRTRLAAAGIGPATVSVSGDRITVDVPSADRAKAAALAVPGKLGIYDWEASVLGPDGRPSPGDDSVTGGPGADSDAAVSRYEAVLRASKAPASGGPSAYWLVDATAREVLGGPESSRDALLGGASVPKGARVLEAPGGVRVVHAPGPGSGGWHALAGPAPVGNADVSSALAMREPATRDPMVAIDLNPDGQRAFSALTREVARRGQAAVKPGEDPMLAVQHLAIVVDDDLDAVPFIDFQQAPDGIDGAGGVQIQGGLTLERAKEIATILSSGAMPATLEPITP
jgi:SecD/SecF fusion protein